MIINPETIENKYKCNKQIANYLTFECNLPLLGFDKDYFYFVNTNKLKECVKNMPLRLKLLFKFKARR